MALITGKVVFAASATIFAADQNTNDGTIWNDYNGNITNANISSSAAIAYSKLALTGGIVNADIATGAAIAASKLSLVAPGAVGTTTPAAGKFTTLEATSTFKVGTTHQGDILYDNGTSLIRLVPGTSGQFLKSQGAGANVVWGDAFLSSTLFEYEGVCEAVATEYNNSSLNGAGSASTFYRYLVTASGTYASVWSTQWTKVAGVSTITIKCRLWAQTTGLSSQANLKVDVGGQNNNVSGTVEQLTPEWKSFTIDVSGLVTGTAYDVVASLKNVAAVAQNVYCANIIAFGS